ncbi:transposase [uncultured Prevotella sp.]|uniref:transposase n=1 Tax=uncultured Prevotella sp. TaxID=159272 RepID=UPI0026396C37|nr:transposase [uncultured Prevotella sp.]
MLRLNSLNTIHSGSIQRDSYDEEQDREFAFLTNAFHLTAPEIANLYKNRWQIEHFFYDKYIVMRSAIIPPVKNRLIS